MEKIRIVEQNVEGKLMLCVVRRDGQPLTSDGIVSYNFELDDWWQAVLCSVDLEKQ